MEKTKAPVEYYEMFTKAGDAECSRLVKRIAKRISSKRRYTGPEVLAMVEEGMDKIAKRHSEVHDTEPRGEIAHHVSKALSKAGYAFFIGSFLNVQEGDYSSMYREIQNT